jgi:hypothetical protein
MKRREPRTHALHASASFMAPAHWAWKRLPRSEMRRGSQSIDFKQAIDWLSRRTSPCGKRFRIQYAGAFREKNGHTFSVFFSLWRSELATKTTLIVCCHV